MKTGRIIQSSIIVVMFCIAVTVAEAQSFSPIMSMPSFGNVTSYMNSYMNGLPAHAKSQESIPTTGYTQVSPGSGMFNFTMPVFNMPSTGSTNMSSINASSMTTMPQIGLSSFASPDLMSSLLAGSVTQTNLGANPNTTNNYTLADNGSTINMKVKDMIHVQLPFHIQSGGVWNVTVTKGLNISDQRTCTPLLSASSITGGTDLTAIQEFDVLAVSPGTQYIYGKCSGSNQTYMLTVNVS